MKIKVYALVVHFPYEGADILGIYTSKSLAENEKAKAKKKDDSNDYNEFKVEGYFLDE